MVSICVTRARVQREEVNAMGSTATASNDDLAHGFRAAAEARDVVALAKLYDPDARFWNNVLRAR